MAKINSINYDYGKITVWYDDTESMTDYFHHYTLTQKDSIDWIKKDGLDTITGTMTNYEIVQYKRALRYFKRVEKLTGKKIKIDIKHLKYNNYETLEESKAELPKAKEILKPLGFKAFIYVANESYNPIYVIATEGVKYVDWRKIEDY